MKYQIVSLLRFPFEECIISIEVSLILIGLVERPGSTNLRVRHPLFYFVGIMKELSVFVDESGDWGEYDFHAPYYIISLVLHDKKLFSCYDEFENSVRFAQTYAKQEEMQMFAKGGEFVENADRMSKRIWIRLFYQPDDCGRKTLPGR